jgi:MOSC domain-containing protein YiiM
MTSFPPRWVKLSERSVAENTSRVVTRPPRKSAEAAEESRRSAFEGSGSVEAIFITSRAGAPMVAADAVSAVAGCGLAGDRYSARTGYWSGLDYCQVTLIEGEALDEIVEVYGIDVGTGQHRRNIVTRRLAFRSLIGVTVSIGEAVLAYDRPRPPCRYIESITEPGMTRALAARRGGICMNVLKSGTIRVGDTIRVIAPSEHRVVTVVL